MTKLMMKPGIITGNQLDELFEYCKEVECALPAINVIGSSTMNAAMQAAREAQAPIIIQISNGGALFNAGKFLDNSNQQGAIAGSVAGAHHIRVLSQCYGVPVVLHTDHCARKLLPWISGLIAESEKYYQQHGTTLYSTHMLDLSEDPLEENIATCVEYLERLDAIGMVLEFELGVTGGEEDGVDNTSVDSARLYTQPDEVLAAYDAFNGKGKFMVAAAFGNTHGVYKPGNVKLRPIILKNSQEKVARERHTASAKPLNMVFHGGSGSSLADIREGVSYGVIKFNIDTDTQWAFTNPIKEYMDARDAYLHSQIGNPEGDDHPNKKYIDPRNWLHLGEKGIVARLRQAFDALNATNKFQFSS